VTGVQTCALPIWPLSYLKPVLLGRAVSARFLRPFTFGLPAFFGSLVGHTKFFLSHRSFASTIDPIFEQAVGRKF